MIQLFMFKVGSYIVLIFIIINEQNNRLVKGDRGAVGLTEDASQLLNWMVSGPEMAWNVNEFESSLELIKCQQNKSNNVE